MNQAAMNYINNYILLYLILGTVFTSGF